METIECEHCGAKMDVLSHRQPLTYVERDDNGQRSFIIFGADNWLLHQCVIGDEQH